MYGGGVSPMFAQQATSPQPSYMFPVETFPGRTPSPLDAPTTSYLGGYQPLTPVNIAQPVHINAGLSPAGITHMNTGLQGQF